MTRVDRADCPTVQANDARDALRSGRVSCASVDDADVPTYLVYLDDYTPLGLVRLVDGGWVASRPGWRDDQTRSKRHAAVRRVVMSHPRSILGL